MHGVIRPEISKMDLGGAKMMVDGALGIRMQKHGCDSYASNHETLGMMIEEFDEFEGAVHDNDELHTLNELVDMAVVAIWGIASILHSRGSTKGDDSE